MKHSIEPMTLPQPHPITEGRQSPWHLLKRRSALYWLTAGVLATTLGLASCSTQSSLPDVSAQGPRPKLVVLLVVDGLPQRQVMAYQDQWVADGFARFFKQGRAYNQAHYGHAFTVTAAGHAAMLSGAYSHRSGIIGNTWRDQQTGADVYCTSDSSATYIGHATKPLDGTSPKNLRVQSLGDVLKGLDARSKVLAVSGKDRGAILPAGKLGTAYMYMSSTGQFASSTHYMPAHPAWVNAFNQQKPADAYLGRTWQPLLPDAAYQRSLPDLQTWYAPGGALPKTLATTPDAKFYTSLLPSPYADEMTVAFARAAIAGEQLGADDAPDILSVSLSGHDYINHAYGAESRLSQDHFLRLDRMLQDFFAYLDDKVGKDNYVAVLTADHGFMPTPEHLSQMGKDGGRIDPRALLDRIRKALQPFGEGAWVHGFSGSSVLLNRELIASQGKDATAMAQVVAQVLKQEPGIAAAYTRDELLANPSPTDPLFAMMRKSWHPDVSGQVQYAVRSGWMFATARTGTTHGSPHEYDTHVPLLMYGPAWLKPAQVSQRVEVADIAPTLAALLKVPAPAQSEGKLLPLR